MYKSKPRPIDLSKESQKKVEDKKDDYRSVLTEESTPLFNLLREWRNEKAKKAGSPPYILFNNLQLAQIAGKKPETLTQLASVEGVGRAKIKKLSGCVVAGLSHQLRRQVVGDMVNTGMSAGCQKRDERK